MTWVRSIDDSKKFVTPENWNEESMPWKVISTLKFDQYHALLPMFWIVREAYELEEKLGFEKEGLWLEIGKLNQSEKKIQTEKLIKFEN